MRFRLPSFLPFLSSLPFLPSLPSLFHPNSRELPFLKLPTLPTNSPSMPSSLSFILFLFFFFLFPAFIPFPNNFQIHLPWYGWDSRTKRPLFANYKFLYPTNETKPSSVLLKKKEKKKRENIYNKKGSFAILFKKKIKMFEKS